MARITVRVDPAAIARRVLHEQYARDMAEGRRQRATTFRPKKGRGSYTRRRKHKES